MRCGCSKKGTHEMGVAFLWFPFKTPKEYHENRHTHFKNRLQSRSRYHELHESDIQGQLPNAGFKQNPPSHPGYLARAPKCHHFQVLRGEQEVGSLSEGAVAGAKDRESFGGWGV